MKKRITYLVLLVVSILLIISCHQDINVRNVVSSVSEINQVKGIKDSFIESLESSICEMSTTAQELLKSSVFSDSSYSSKGLFDDVDDSLFDLLPESEQEVIEEYIKSYISDLKETASKITVFNNGIPDGCEESDEYVVIYGVTYSKLIPETLETAFALRDDIYAGTVSKGNKQWYIVRWDLLGAPRGRIFYSYGSNFSDAEKKIIRSCMDEWQNKTGGAVSFEEKKLNWWGELKWALGITRNVKFWKESGKDYYTNASLGPAAWAYFKINTDKMFKSGKDPIISDYYYRVTRHAILHELGHVICLQNEYERSDRDKFIQLALDETSFPGTSGIIRWLQKIFTVDYGDYDYKSVMNEYDAYYIMGTDRLITFDDIEKVSHNDVLTVKRIYDNISESEMKRQWEDSKSSLLKYY